MITIKGKVNEVKAPVTFQYKNGTSGSNKEIVLEVKNGNRVAYESVKVSVDTNVQVGQEVEVPVTYFHGVGKNGKSFLIWSEAKV